ncbi:hypothetical protein ELE36_13260 [Pseudolysobacter antarcticus]|uniref:Right-handed parallel beta-helix repeat-containing protein n=1 Tax=Pseudolysobacter antarcticus TaxID=2511995 RepID=A0A411HL39_9GAMM|nr:choice-of-anchor Q domain-containing protein [Pseudolysobacter antarcticus]QBB71246.1 hypothetical protein ELE36_13260 [Pseudolysobacter antarcticus]
MQIHNRLLPILISFVAMFFCANVRAALFCVNSVAGLNFALTTSQDNGQNDQIDIVAGSYALNAGGLQFFSSEANSITIFGGYNADCSQLTTAVTSLNGENIYQVLRVIQSSTSAAASIHIERITFIAGKTGADGGGGLFATAQNGDVRIESNRFLLNHAENYAGAIYINIGGLITLRNNLFYLNSALQMGVGELQTSNSVAYITGNTMINNSAATVTNGIGGLYVESNSGTNFWLSNNILWNNNANGGVDLYAGASVILRNNDIGTSAFVLPNALSQNNQSVDPDFAPCVGLLCSSFELKRGSPLVDAGIDNPPTGLGSYDLAGKLRTIGPHVDIGAFEEDVIFASGYEGGPF